MPRPYRSPSPTGTTSDRSQRRRSPSLNRHRDRDLYYERGSHYDGRGRLDRSPDRRSYERDTRYRRPRSRDRSRSPERYSRRYHTSDYDRSERRDASREHRKRRREDSPDRRYESRREDDRDRKAPRSSSGQARESPKSKEPPKMTEEQIKAERLAKLEAWKAKHKAKQEEQRKEEESRGGPMSILQEMDKKAIESQTPIEPDEEDGDESEASSKPAPYAGKFDPKAIAKRAASTSKASSALGADIAIPQGLTAPQSSASQANRSLHASSRKLNGPIRSSVLGSYKAKGGLSGFGRGQKDSSKTQNFVQPGVDLEEGESIQRKLAKLPALTDDDLAATAADPDENDDDEDDITGADMEMADGEEAEAAAARAAAEKREERLLAKSQSQNATDEVEMKEVTTENEGKQEEEEEEDPLDAFMKTLDTTKAPGLPELTGKPGRGASKELLGDDDPEMTAVDDGGAEDIVNLAKKAASKRKDIPKVDHQKMNYLEFRKNFYTEPAELAEMSDEDLINLRHDLDGIKVRGVNVPKPVTRWEQYGLGIQSLQVVQNLGFKAPTPIQAQAIPAIMSGRDVIAIAKTGSGKTIAFLLPMFRHIKDQPPLSNLDGPIGLVMAPTRELATQIHKECRPWLKALNLRAVCAYGGAPIKDQIADLKRGAEIIICTAGRMIDLLAANSGRVTNLRRVTYCVLDEADRMFDMGFEPQIMRILGNIRPDRQTVLFSATFPRTMEALARKTLTKAVEITIGGKGTVAPEIEQKVEVLEEKEKFLQVLQYLGECHMDEEAQSLIFVDRHESAEDLSSAIMRRGYPCMSIHGGKDQYDRDEIIQQYRKGIFPVLVATSVAARGLDVKNIKLVINFDCPNHLEDYIHRAGRTGRAGSKGLAVTFITPKQERYAVDIAKALKESGQPIPEEVQKLVDSFRGKVKEGKEKEFKAGFGGKGIEEFDKKTEASRKRVRGVFGTDDQMDDEEEEEEVRRDEDGDDETAENQFKVKPAEAKTQAPPAPAPPTQTGFDPNTLNLTIEVKKTERPAPTKEENPKDRMKGVNAAVAAINARLRKGGELQRNAPIDNKGPDAGAFHSIFEINDLPQKARWAVTNRSNVARILESTGTSITSKGSFYTSGAVPGPNDLPKLYILVEGDTEMVVTQAMKELHRLAKDGAAAAIESESRQPGRYSVV